MDSEVSDIHANTSVDSPASTSIAFTGQGTISRDITSADDASNSNLSSIISDPTQEGAWARIPNFLATVFRWPRPSVEPPRRHAGSADRTTRANHRYNPVSSPTRVRSATSHSQHRTRHDKAQVLGTTSISQPIGEGDQVRYIKSEDHDVLVKEEEHDLCIKEEEHDVSIKEEANDHSMEGLRYHPHHTYSPGNVSGMSRIDSVLQDLEESRKRVLELREAHSALAFSQDGMVSRLHELEVSTTNLKTRVHSLNADLLHIQELKSRQQLESQQQASTLKQLRRRVEEGDREILHHEQGTSQLRALIQESTDVDIELDNMPDVLPLGEACISHTPSDAEQMKTSPISQDVNAQGSCLLSDIQKAIGSSMDFPDSNRNTNNDPNAMSIDKLHPLSFDRSTLAVDSNIQVYMMDVDEPSATNPASTSAIPSSGHSNQHDGPSGATQSEHTTNNGNDPPLNTRGDGPGVNGGNGTGTAGGNVATGQDGIFVSFLGTSHDQRMYLLRLLHASTTTTSGGESSSGQSSTPGQQVYPFGATTQPAIPPHIVQYLITNPPTALGRNGSLPVNDPPQTNTPGQNGEQQPGAGSSAQAPERNDADAGNNNPEPGPDGGNPRILYPRSKRKDMQRACRQIIRTRLNIIADDDIIVHNAVKDDEIKDYMDGVSAGPNLEDLRLHMVGKDSLWDREAVRLLVHELERKVLRTCSMESVDWRYIEDIMWKRFRRLLTIWNSFKAKRKANGEIEDARESEERFLLERENRKRKARHNSRRKRKHTARKRNIDILKYKADITRDSDQDHLGSLNFLGDLVTSLGVDGMSDEETDTENPTHHNVVVAEWRRDINHELAIIDRIKPENPGLLDPRGAKIVPRVHNNRPDSRKPPARLPVNLYAQPWLENQTDTYKGLYLKPKGPIEWKNIGARIG